MVAFVLCCVCKQAVAAHPVELSQADDRQQAANQIADYKRQLTERPNWTEGWYNLGALEYSVSRYDDAIEPLQKVVGAAPGVGDGWALLGLCEFETHRYDDARRDLERAESLHVNDEETARVAGYHLALLWIREGKFDDASNLLLERVAREARSPQVTFALGLTLLQISALPGETNPEQDSDIAAAGTLAASKDTGVEALSAFVLAHPNAPNVHLVYALSLEKAGQKTEALKELRKGAQRTPECPEIWIAISRLEQETGNSKASQDAASRASALAKMHHDVPDKSATRNGDDTAAWARAMQDYGSGQYANVIAELTTFLKQYSDDGTAWAVLGLSEFALGEDQSALLHLQRGAALGMRGNASSLEEARYTTAILLLQENKFEQASDLLRTAARAFPQDEKVRFALGLCLLRIPMLPERSKAPQDLIDQAGQIMLLLDQSKYDDAFPIFKTLLDKYPSVPFMHYAYGTALMALSQFDEAAAQMNAEMVISPNSSLPLLRLASINLRRHAPADAIGPAKQAVKLAPDSSEAYYLLGRAALDTGDNPTALKELQRAVVLDPDSPEIHFILARAYAKSGMREAAAKERAEFQRLNELVERQQSQSADQMYTGPREASTVTSGKLNP